MAYTCVCPAAGAAGVATAAEPHALVVSAQLAPADVALKAESVPMTQAESVSTDDPADVGWIIAQVSGIMRNAKSIRRHTLSLERLVKLKARCGSPWTGSVEDVLDSRQLRSLWQSRAFTEEGLSSNMFLGIAESCRVVACCLTEHLGKACGLALQAERDGLQGVVDDITCDIAHEDAQAWARQVLDPDTNGAGEESIEAGEGEEDCDDDGWDDSEDEDDLRMIDGSGRGVASALAARTDLLAALRKLIAETPLLNPVRRRASSVLIVSA